MEKRHGARTWAVESGRDLGIVGQRTGKALRWEELSDRRHGDGLKGLGASLRQERRDGNPEAAVGKVGGFCVSEGRGAQGSKH